MVAFLSMRWGSTTLSQPQPLGFGLVAHLMVQSLRSTSVYLVPFLSAHPPAVKAHGRGISRRFGAGYMPQELQSSFGA